MRRRWLDKTFWFDALGVLSGQRQLGVNPSHQEWQYLLRERGLPTIKIELLRDNPKGVDDLDKLEPLLTALGDYPTHLIDAHLERMADAGDVA